MDATNIDAIISKTFSQPYIGFVVCDYLYPFMHGEDKPVDIYFVFPANLVNVVELQHIEDNLDKVYDEYNIMQANRRIEMIVEPFTLSDLQEEYRDFDMVDNLYIMPPTAFEDKSPTDIFARLVLEYGVPLVFPQ